MPSNNLFYPGARDTDLFLLVKESDEKAFEELYKRHWPTLFSIACKRLGSREKAEDIVQNIFIDLYRRRTTIEFTISLQAYLLQALKFKILNEYRSAANRNKYRQSLFLGESCKIDFSNPLEAKDLEIKINMILDRLPEKCKKVFLLSRNENLSYKDISAGLCITVSTVEKHISKALKTLRGQICTLVLAILLPCTCLLAQSQPGGTYKKEMVSLQLAIQNNFYDAPSGNYFVTVDSTKREIHNGHLRKYTYLWSLCALYQAANEMEKLDPGSNLMSPLITLMRTYYNPAPPKPGFTDYIMELQPGERYYDDNEWIGITALDAYARKKDKKDLTLGQAMYDFVMTGHDQVLGGGIYWKEGSLSSKNTCSNGPGILVALQLYKATKNKAFLDTALQIFSWTNRCLQTPSGLYYDNIRVKDSSISRPVLSYNTGTMLEANVYLYEITGDKKYLINANAIAEASLAYFYGSGKFRDDYWFNAVLLRAYQHLLNDNPDTRYIIAFKKCLDNALQNDRNKKGLFQGKDGEMNLVDHGGMLEILARYAWLETRYRL